MGAFKLWSLTAVLVATASIGAMLTVPSVGLPPVETSEVPYRVIGAWEGRVAVFLPQETVPERVLETRLATLPDEEQQRLQAGVTVADAAELAARLEDYTS